MVTTPEIGRIFEHLRFREKINGRPTVFVSGSWQEEKAIAISPEAYKLGRLLAESGFDLTIGPGTGVARYVIDGYRSVPERGKVIFYLPKESEMERVGERMEKGADEIIKTELDYPMRNLIQVRESDALVAIGGGAGTVTEIIATALDYRKPTIVLDGGEASQAIKILSDLKSKVEFASRVEEVVEFLQEKLLRSSLDLTT